MIELSYLSVLLILSLCHAAVRLGLNAKRITFPSVTAFGHSAPFGPLAGIGIRTSAAVIWRGSAGYRLKSGRLCAALILLLLSACSRHTLQYMWPAGYTAENYKRDSYECRGQTGVRPYMAEDTVGGIFDQHNNRNNYRQCMEFRGYELVRVSRSAGNLNPKPGSIREITPEEIEARRR